jgi:nuclear protein localization family protein 4
MLLRLRSRDGLERIQVDPNAPVSSLKQQISKQLGIPEHDVVLSKEPKLLLSPEPESFQDLSKPSVKLSSALSHGDLVFMHYPEERTVASVIKKTPFDGQLRKMTVEQLIAKQTRIERQETPHCTSVSFDRHAANVFQSYVSGLLNFSRKRGGILYGSKDEEGNVKVEIIFEPAQEGGEESLTLERHTEEEQRADFIAKALGLEKVGWIFTEQQRKGLYPEHRGSLTDVCLARRVGQHSTHWCGVPGRSRRGQQ